MDFPTKQIGVSGLQFPLNYSIEISNQLNNVQSPSVLYWLVHHASPIVSFKFLNLLPSVSIFKYHPLIIINQRIFGVKKSPQPTLVFFSGRLGGGPPLPQRLGTNAEAQQRTAIVVEDALATTVGARCLPIIT